MSNRSGLLAAGGSILAALVASACCWLPLLLLAFGVSAAGISAKFEAVRPYFLGGAAVLLAGGFYLSYFRKPACDPGDSCATPSKQLSRFNRVMLWVATVLVLGIGLFPNYVGLIASQQGQATPPNAVATEKVSVRIEGMTCEACTRHVKEELLTVPGVASASVNYSEGLATVFFEPSHPPLRSQLVEAVLRAGYKVAPN